MTLSSGGQRSAFGLSLCVLLLVALLLRCPALNERPMHADESVHTVKFRELWETGQYRYDPNEFHGPTIYYAALPVVALRHRINFADTQESDYRLPIALAGAAMSLWPLLLVPILGYRIPLMAATLFAVSPAFVFYARYFIQETFLVFFTLGLLTCGYRYIRNPSLTWAGAAGVCAGGMIASKETAVLTFAAIGIAWLITRRQLPTVSGKHLAVAVGLLLLVASAFLSGFLSHPLGPVDYLKSFTPWLSRAGGTDMHREPWYYYLRLLIGSWPKAGTGRTTEAFILGLALVGAVSSLFRIPRFLPPGVQGIARFLAVYTILLHLIYSAIPYKTPWCVLTVLQGMILLAGIGAFVLLRSVPGKIGKAVFGLLLGVGMIHLGWQAYNSSFVSFNDPHCPYVYSPTAPETTELPGKMEALARVSPTGDRMVIKIFSSDGYYWPLPWYLRRFPNVGYWVGVPQDSDAPVILASAEFDDELTRRLDKTHLMTGYFALRPGVLMETWVRLDLWQKYLTTRTPDTTQ
jgi:uncharacterized protein (TIGR03663 family)